MASSIKRKVFTARSDTMELDDDDPLLSAPPPPPKHQPPRDSFMAPPTLA